MSDAGVKVTFSALRKLLKRAENAWIAGNPSRACSLVFSESSFPEYLKLPQRSDQEVLHGRLRMLEHDGAIEIDWDPLAGKFGQIERIRLVDADKLAAAANLIPLWALHAHAAEALLPWMERYNVRLILERWKAGKTVRGYGPQDTQPFIDACKVLDHCQTLYDGEDILVRRLSASLFSDSKRIEEITPVLDALSAEEIDSPIRSISEVLEPLGLIKMPQPVLISGRGTLELADGTIIRIPTPFIGVSPHAVSAFRLDADCRYLMTIENLTTFHELAMGRAGSVEGLLIYTAGMPSPSMLQTYGHASSVAEGLPIWHWGDIDLGGFRIASALARHTRNNICLWSMNPKSLPHMGERKLLSVDELGEIQKICARHGWDAIATEVASAGKAIEQESLPLSLPSSEQQMQ